MSPHPSDPRAPRWLSNAFEAFLILLGVAAALLPVVLPEIAR